MAALERGQTRQRAGRRIRPFLRPLHLFLHKEAVGTVSGVDRIESLETKLATFICPEYGIADLRPWYSNRCSLCKQEREGRGSSALPQPVVWCRVNRNLEVS